MMNLDVYQAMGVSTILVFHQQEDQLVVAVFDMVVPNAPLFTFALNESAKEKLLSLKDNQLIIPGMNIKEFARYQQTGELPAWAGKL